MTNTIRPCFICPILSLLLLLVSIVGVGQNNTGMRDGRQESICEATRSVIDNLPGEVQFGVRIDEAGNVYFSIGNRQSFDELLKDARDGIAIDIVRKEQFDCRSLEVYGNSRTPRGEMIGPVLLPELKKNIVLDAMGSISVKIGTVSPKLKAKVKELEGNLMIIKSGILCYYSNFVDIDRSLWELLPMGLHADTIINTEKLAGTSGDFVRFTKKLQVVIPFEKNKAVYNQADLKPLYDSLRLADFTIMKVSIRAYSSVEGAEAINRQLQQERVQSVVKALQQYQSGEILQEVEASENWLEFLDDIKQTPYASYAQLSRAATKQKLLDKTVAVQLEPILKKHRKAIVTIYLDKKRSLNDVSAQSLPQQFKEALAKKAFYKAALIQEEVFDRIADRSLPSDYASKLEIPREKQYSMLLSDRETYRIMLGLTGEEEALENFRSLLKLDPNSGRIRYNICALNFFFWKVDTSFLDRHAFLKDIQSLYQYKIDSSLVKRMLVNYHIVNCEHNMYRGNYAEKDQSLLYIVSNYSEVKLSDAEVLSLAKYLCLYSKCDIAGELVAERVTSIDVNEDLLFYHINLKFFEPQELWDGSFDKEINNAINLNKTRFCRFFNSVNNGGASFQLLESPLRTKYCEHCLVK